MILFTIQITLIIFFITKHNRRRLFNVNRSFLLDENSIVLYNNKQYKVHNIYTNNKNILFVPQSPYNIVYNPNDLCCIG